MITGPTGPTFEQLAAEEAKKPVVIVPAPVKEPKATPAPAEKPAAKAATVKAEEKVKGK